MGLTKLQPDQLNVSSTNITQTITNGVTDKAPSEDAVFDALAGKQATLVSGTNIKTINGSSILGSGDLTVSGGGGTSWDALIFEDSDEFVNIPSSTAVGNKFYQSTSGTGTTPTWSMAHSAKHVGVWTLPIGTGSLTSLVLGGAYSVLPFNPADGAIEFEMVIKTGPHIQGSTGGSGLEDWWTRFGLMGNNAFNGDALCFRQVGSEWHIRIDIGANVQEYDTNIACAVDTWYRLKLSMNAAQTTCSYEVENLQTNTESTGSFTPTYTWSSGSNNMTLAAWIYRWGGSTEWSVLWEKYRIKQTYTNF